MKSVQTKLRNYREAAEFCEGIPVNQFKNRVQMGNGPAFIKITPRLIMFREDDLRAWMNTWERVTSHA